MDMKKHCVYLVIRFEFHFYWQVTVAAIKIGVMALAILPQLANITLDGYSKDLAEELQTYAELWIGLCTSILLFASIFQWLKL